MQREVIVVGGGIAGLQCARELHHAGLRVQVLEREPRVGGRVATHHFKGQPIDFGPMFLHGDTEPFLRAIGAVEGAVLGPVWPQRVQGQGAPCQPDAFEATEQRAIIPTGMNTFARHLAKGLDVHLGTAVREISVTSGSLRLHCTDGKDFNGSDVVLAMALEEMLQLLAPLESYPDVRGIRALLGMFASVPSLTLLAAYPLPRAIPDWHIHYPEDSSCLQLIAQDSSKRHEPEYLTLVIQARPRWSRERLEQDEAMWSADLLKETAELVGDWALQPLWTLPHRWRFARVDRGNELSRPLLARLPEGIRLGLAGDVFSPGGGVQAAWLSGSALAQRILHEE